MDKYISPNNVVSDLQKGVKRVTQDKMTLRSNAARQMNWNDPENFEIKTLSVERQLEQLVKQVTTLVDGKPSNYRKVQSKSGQALLDVSYHSNYS